MKTSGLEVGGEHHRTGRAGGARALLPVAFEALAVLWAVAIVGLYLARHWREIVGVLP